jgi:hypothetical protein
MEMTKFQQTQYKIVYLISFIQDFFIYIKLNMDFLSNNAASNIKKARFCTKLTHSAVISVIWNTYYSFHSELAYVLHFLLISMAVPYLYYEKTSFHASNRKFFSNCGLQDTGHCDRLWGGGGGGGS